AGPRDAPRTRLRRRTHRQPRLPYRPRGAAGAADGDAQLRSVDRHGHPRPDRGELRGSRGVPGRRSGGGGPHPDGCIRDRVVHALDRAGGVMAVGSTSTGLREHGSSILVALLSSAFGVALLQVTGVLADVIGNDPVTGASGTVQLMLMLLAWVFIAIAIYVGSIVTVNTFSTIVAGRARMIALLRLIGSSARQQRRAVAREGLVVGLIGSVAGAAVGTALAVLLERVAVWVGWLPEQPHDWADVGLAAPIVAVVLTTWLAAWVG